MSVPPRMASQMKEMLVCRATYRDAKGLYLVDSSGAVVEELARSGPGEWLGHFAVSPNGRWVAYTCRIRRRDDRDPYPAIRVVPAVGGESIDLEPWDPRYETCYQNPVFSPSGEKMVWEFALRHPGNPDLQVMKLYDLGDRLDAMSTGLSITNPMRIGNHAPQFMPDSERIVYFGNFAYEDLLEVCLYDPRVAKDDVLGAIGWRLTEGADGVWHRPKALAVQPEWEQIFFIQGHTMGAERICVILLADLPPGSHRKEFDSVGRDHHHIGALDVSHDGLLIAYDGDGAIYLLRTDGSDLRRISPDGMNCRGPRLSEDGTRVAYIGDSRLCVSEIYSGATVTASAAEIQVEAVEWT